eukprot:g19383.t1
MDVQFLYMAIPHQEGLRALRFFLEQKPEPSPLTTTLFCLAELMFTLYTSLLTPLICFSSVVDCTFNQVRPISCTSALTLSLPSHNSNRVPLVLTYHPTSIHIQKI